MTVIESLGRGGAERLVVTTDAKLNRQRFSHHVVSLFGPDPLAAELEERGTRVTRLGMAGPEALFPAIRQLRGMVASEAPDIVHTHLFAANVAGRLAAGDARVVTTLHNPDYGSDRGHGWRYAVRCFLDRVTGHSGTHRFLAVSEHVAQDYRDHMGFADIEIHHNAVDTADIAARVAGADSSALRRQLGVAESAFVVLHVGRFHPQKGQDLLVRAFAGLHRHDPGARLIFVGGGDDGLLREEAVRLEVSNAVLFEGQVANVAPFLAAADVFAFPSRFEAFGIALLEAMAAGLPTLVTRIPGLTEVATPGTSLMVTPEDVAELTRALILLHDDAGLRAALGGAGRARANEFDIHAAVRRLERIYLVEAERGPRSRTVAS